MPLLAARTGYDDVGDVRIFDSGAHVLREPPVRDFEQHRRWKRARRETRVLVFTKRLPIAAIAVSMSMSVAEFWPTDTTWNRVADWIGMHLP